MPVSIDACVPLDDCVPPHFGSLESIFRRTTVTHRTQKVIQGGDCCPRRMSLLRFPWLFPIRNPCELRGLYRRSYFGPRTCGRRINHFSSKCSGFLIRVSPSHPYWGRCNAIVPLHLPDALEYKFLGCIPDHHWLWIWQYRSHPYNAGRTRMGGVVANRCVRCMQWL